MRGYFSEGVESWFVHFNRLASAWGSSYESGDMIHLDLVQEQSERWTEVETLQKTDSTFLKWEIESFQSIATILCNGQTVWDAVRSLLGVTMAEQGVFKYGARKDLHWFAGSVASNRRRIRVAGWNMTLGRAGLTASEEASLGRLFEARSRST